MFQSDIIKKATTPPMDFIEGKRQDI